MFEEGGDTAHAAVDLLPTTPSAPERFLALLARPSAGSAADAKVPVTVGWR